MPQIELFPTSFIRNRGLLSNHWFENRLLLEPEWDSLREEGLESLGKIQAIWEREKGRVQKYETEASLEQAFIQPVLESLGWKLIYQTFLQGRKPDYALFIDEVNKDGALNADRKSEEFWQWPTLIADAKAWHIPLNRPSRHDGKREYPPEQIEWYLDRSRLDFGILTSGTNWRLIPREYQPQQRRFQAYLECDLPGLLDAISETNSLTDRELLKEDFLRFFLFFSPAGFRADGELVSLMERANKGSSQYRIGVGEGLKNRAFEALRFSIEGFLNFPKNGLHPKTDLEICRSESFILLYRLLFIMYAEDRRLLPYRINKLYTENRSLGRHRDEIAAQFVRLSEERDDDFSRESTAIWEDLQSLFDLVDSGHARYHVPQYNGGLFDKSRNEFLNEKKISDYYLSRVIDQLGRAIDPGDASNELLRVDYRDLAIQHLGGIYEGLLELHPTYAMENMVVIHRRRKGQLEEKFIAESSPIPAGWQLSEMAYRKGSIYLKTAKDERRASGSYYTPDHIVNYIVEKTLDPLCDAISEELQTDLDNVSNELKNANGQAKAELEERFNSLTRDFDDRILKMNVLDPAMGSGHFLIRACQKLAERIAIHPYSADEMTDTIQEDESAVSYWKRKVVENCLYGVDLNELAVELAKLALWLETVAGDEPLSFLNHHLRHGNSLVGGRVDQLGTLPDDIELRVHFKSQVETKVGAFLKPLEEIRKTSSTTAADIKKKEKLFEKFEKAREPFRQVADLWCSAFCNDSAITSEQYEQAIKEVTKPQRFAELVNEKWFRDAIRLTNKEFGRCFHWELEFPEVYYNQSSRIENAGFDAVIGNPPYDVLSEKEIGRSLTSLKNVIECDSVFAPSATGKNNLYKLFICKALELIRLDGHFGFITPMAILGDKITLALRKKMFELGTFTAIESFPQKDNASLRVFPEAKLSTAVFTFVKSLNSNGQRFTARVHPANTVDLESPSLVLNSDAVPKYDPQNLTIVSCSQSDWDFATKIMASGRMQRLGDVAEFFQGEINETNVRKAGHFTGDSATGKLVTRGASICLYVVRPASQGNDLYMNTESFLYDKSETSKAFHFKHDRVGVQESCPQNNFRRIIASYIPAGEFCNHTINYCPVHKSEIAQQMLMAILNSKLADWYFRLGSTNAHVSQYQLDNLPFPVFAAQEVEASNEFAELIRNGAVDEVYTQLRDELAEPPFSDNVRQAIIASVDRICEIENARGEISRSARSALSPDAQPFQDLIDRLFFEMAGLTFAESRQLEQRLSEML